MKAKYGDYVALTHQRMKAEEISQLGYEDTYRQAPSQNIMVREGSQTTQSGSISRNPLKLPRSKFKDLQMDRGPAIVLSKSKQCDAEEYYGITTRAANEYIDLATWQIW